jgi:7-cyano-7-deazaguanine synthase
MDSAVAAAWARDRGWRILALTVDYGQRHRAELEASRAVGRWLGVDEHLILEVDLRPVGGSALTGELDLPRDTPTGQIPVTYVPARNTLFLALALGLAEARSARAVVLGVNRVDYSGYPDCRPEFLDAFRRVADLGTRAGIEGRAPEILAPLIDLPKAEIVTLGARLDVPFGHTVSCYDPTSAGEACGTCDSCRLRRNGFAEAGLPDPTRYA